jgi:hypothetical protein
MAKAENAPGYFRSVILSRWVVSSTLAKGPAPRRALIAYCTNSKASENLKKDCLQRFIMKQKMMNSKS